MMYGDEKSDPAIVAENRANADGRPSAEGGVRRTPSRARVSRGLERARRAAQLNKEERFTTLLHHVDVDLRRSQKDRTTRTAINRLVARWLPKPRITHPWPEQRFAVTHPRWEPDARIGHIRFCAGVRRNAHPYREKDARR